MNTHSVRELRGDDHDWVVGMLTERWGSARIVTRGRLHHADKLPGFVVEREGKLVGLVTYRIDGTECEIITLDSSVERQGVGSRLLSRVREAAVCAGCDRLWLITTNDNIPAQLFYQKRGFHLVVVHKNAINQARKLKPEIPDVGQNGIPIRDEIELEMLLGKSMESPVKESY